MKTPLALLLLAFAASAAAAAQDAPNPFVKKATSERPLPPPGPAFASLLENFLVPPDLLDEWLRDHPLADDATELRAAVQDWVAAGKAKIDHAAFTLGTGGRASISESIMEKMYPTEFTAGGAGAWPWPNSFDTRNLGHTLESGVTAVDGANSLWADIELLELVSTESFQPLIERTSKPTDVFLPRIRAMRVRQHDSNASEDSADPFAAPSAKSNPVDFTRPRGVVFTPGVFYLAARFDPLSDETADSKLTRLVFYRGEIAPTAANSGTPVPDASRIAFRMVRVSLPAFSTWMLGRSPLVASNEAWSAADDWRKEGTADTIGTLSSTVRESVTTTMENIDEYIYPTEVETGTDMRLLETWEEGKSKNGKDGVATMSRYKITPRPGLEGAGLANAFDTRNLGNTAETVISKNGGQYLVRCNWEQVRHLGDFVYHRIKVDDEWIPDMKMPLFASNHLVSTIRVRQGKWTLLGTVSEYLPTEKIDREHCLLVFVRVD